MFSYELTSLKEAKDGLRQILERVIENHEVFLIDREDGENVALIAESELRSLVETVYLLRSPANARRLFDAIAASKAKQIQPQTLEELQKELGIDQEKEKATTGEERENCPASSSF
jgi:antitoxin YefM